MKKSTKFLARLWSDESGISSVEYALMLAFVGAAIIAGAAYLSDAVSGEMGVAADCIKSGTVTVGTTLAGTTTTGC